MDGQTINNIIKITESYQLPEKLLAVLLDDPSKMFEEFLSLGESLDHDWFTEYFEEEHANKSKMAQDFTPQEVCDLLVHIIGNAESIADVCAGTGGLTIGVWRKNPDAKFVCYEYSSRAIPLLLFNLAIRNIEAWVCRCDLLTGEDFEYFRTVPGERFAGVEAMDSWDDIRVGAVVSNPPYSQKYDPKKDKRFSEYAGMLSSNFADYVFVAFALSIMADDARAGFILPHGVLFRSNKEAAFRKMLIEQGKLRSVIGLPDKLFINTDIPTCIMELRNGQAADGILFIDAKDETEKVRSKNILQAQHSQKICDVFDARTDMEHFAHYASIQEIRENSYNLNIPRYVDTYVPEDLPDIVGVLSDLGDLEVRAAETKIELLGMVSQLYGTTPEADLKFRKGLEAYKKAIIGAENDCKQEVMELGF